RLKHGDQTAIFISRPQRAQGLTHRGRMMGEIVDDQHAALFATYLRASLYILKAREGSTNLFLADAPGVGRDNHSETIEKIKLAQQRRLKLAPRLVLAINFKPRQSLAEVSIANLPLRIASGPKSLNSRE